MSRTRSSRIPNAKSSAGDPPFPVINPSQLGGIETSVLDDGPGRGVRIAWVNTGGGLVAFGHPVGATGIKQIAEIFRQMKGLCGDYQIAGPLQRGLTVNMGGDDRTVVSTVIENCA